MYFQCDPNEDVDDWNEDRIWDEFRSRVNGNGFELKEGPSSTRWSCRSAASCTPRCGTATCSWPATPPTPCPPTGAKGLNLAIHDVQVLFEGLDSFYTDRLHRSCWTRTATAPWTGSGRRSTSPTG